MLRGLGWEILRVWSTDWWVDKAGTLQKLDVRLQGLLLASRTQTCGRSREAGGSDAAAAAITKARRMLRRLMLLPQPALAPMAQTPVQLGLVRKSPLAEQQPEEQKAEVYARNAAGAAASAAVFVESDPASVVDAVKADAFFDSGYDAVLLAMIAHVVEVEGPVLDAVLARRIARAHGWQRTGSRIQERVARLAAKAHRTTEEDVGTFYWSAARGPELPTVFRHSADDATRSVDEICMPELVDLARQITVRGTGVEDAIVVMARELGLQRLRAASRGRFEAAMEQTRRNQERD